MTDKEKHRRLSTACRTVLARFRIAVTKDKAMEAFIAAGSMKEIIVALKL